MNSSSSLHRSAPLVTSNVLRRPAATASRRHRPRIRPWACARRRRRITRGLGTGIETATIVTPRSTLEWRAADALPTAANDLQSALLPTTDSPRLETDPAEQLAFLRRRLRRVLFSAPREDIEDLATACWIELDRASRRLEIENWGKLMNTIASRRAIDYLRKLRPLESLDGDGEGEGIQVPVHDAPSRDQLERLRFDIHAFYVEAGATQCAELSLAYFAERSWKTVAEKLGLKHNTVIQRWKRCLDVLRERASGEGEFLAPYRDLLEASAGSPS